MSAQVPERVEVTDEAGHVEVTGVSKDRVQQALELLEVVEGMKVSARDNLVTSINQLMLKVNMPVVSEATQRQVQRSAALNEELLGMGYETHESLAQSRNVPPSSVRTWVSRLRQNHDLFTVKLGGKTLIPSVQLTSADELRPEVAALVRPLSEAGLDGWSLWAWLVKPTGLLSDEVAAELAQTDPRRAQKAAERYAAEIRRARSNIA